MKKRNTFFYSTALLVGIISLVGAYRLTNKETEPIDENSVRIYNPEITQTPSPTPTEPIHYFVKSEGNNLVLYEVDGKVRTPIKTIKINPELFPNEDRNLLKNGIKALSLEEGVQIIENFIS